MCSVGVEKFSVGVGGCLHLHGMIYAISGVRVNKTTNRGQANMLQNLSPLTLWYGVVLVL